MVSCWRQDSADRDSAPAPFAPSLCPSSTMIPLRSHTRPLLLFGAAIVITALWLPSPGTAVASPLRTVPDAPTNGLTLVDYLRSEIRSDDPERREHAMMDVVTLVNCESYCVIHLKSFPGKTLRIHNDSDFGSVIDVSALIPDLIWAYQTGPTDGLRLLALAGLLYLGDETSLKRILSASWAAPPSVRRSTHRHLADFFLLRYPVLEKQIRDTWVLSWADIRAAREATARSHQDKRLTTRPSPPLPF